jgi:hypothetical protein
MSSRELKLSGWWTFAAILLAISGTLNVIWGISAIGHSSFFTQNAQYVTGNLRAWGWITVILGALELVAAGSLFGGGEFGRWFGIFAAAFTSIAALLSIPAYPFWSICIFAISIIIIYELERGPTRPA